MDKRETSKSIKLIFDRSHKMQPGTLCIVERLESQFVSTIMRAFTIMERLTTPPPKDTRTFSSRKEEIDKRKKRTRRKLRIL